MKDSKFGTGGGSQVAIYPRGSTLTSETTGAEAEDAASQGDLHSLSKGMSAPLVLPPQPQPHASQDVPSPGPRDRCESYISAGRQGVTVP
eukprot:scaffold561906_cov18-Prasinocladus_malaysianus.AAC.1